MAVTATGPSESQLARLSKAEVIDHYEALGTEFEMVSERLAELELALEDVGWQKFAVEGTQEFTRAALNSIIRLCRVMYIKNPLIRRSVELPAYYVWAQGVTISAKYDVLNDFVQAFVDDDSNKAELTSHKAQMGKERELRTTGNVFLTLYPDLNTGRVQVRSFPVEEVDDIICNPQDAREPWYYVRHWTERDFSEVTGQIETRSKVAYYPDMHYWWARLRSDAGLSFPQNIGGKPVMATPVYHVKVGELPGMRFGVPEVYASLDWAKAAVADLEDYATIRRALARYAWFLSMKSAGKTKVDATKQKIGSRIDNNTGIDGNPPSLPGSTFIGGDGEQMTPMNTRGATPDPDGARRMWLMVAAANGLPETMYGDADVGNHATSKTLDRPTELMMLDRRTLWIDVLTDILQFATDIAILAPGNDLEGDISADFFGREVLVLPIDPESDKQEPFSRHIDVSFPELLEHDKVANVGAIVDAATLKGHPDSGIMPPKTLAEFLLQALGADDIDEILDKLYDADGQLINPPAPVPAPGTNPNQPPGSQPPANTDPNAPTTTEARISEAVRELVAVLERVAAGTSEETDEE